MLPRPAPPRGNRMPAEGNPPRRAPCSSSNAMIGEETFHPDTRALLAYGRALAGAIDPAARPAPGGGADRVVERLFVMDRQRDGALRLRTFGAELVSLFGADPRGKDFLAFFPKSDQALIAAFVETVSAAGQPGVLRASAETLEGARLGVEILLTPLRVPPVSADRMLGMIQPLGGENLLDGKPVARLRLGAMHPPVARAKPGLRLVVNNR